MEAVAMDNGKRWPDFFLVGAMKAGTTSIYNYLGKHPGIFIPKPKEPHFFACDACKKRQSLIPSAVATEEEYLALFQGAGDDQRIGDFSVSNLWCRSAAKRIAERAPSAKIIAVLRNPIERSFSHYVMRVQQNLEHRSFTEAIESELQGEDASFGYIDVGRYRQQLECYLSVFPRDNTKILWYDDFLDDKYGFVADILSFIGVNGSISRKDMAFSANTGGTPRGGIFSFFYKNRRYYLPIVCKFMSKSARTKVRDRLFINKNDYPRMTEQERALLNSVYEKDIASLADLSGRDLSGWLKTPS